MHSLEGEKVLKSLAFLLEEEVGKWRDLWVLLGRAGDEGGFELLLNGVVLEDVVKGRVWTFSEKRGLGIVLVKKREVLRGEGVEVEFWLVEEEGVWLRKGEGSHGM